MENGTLTRWWHGQIKELVDIHHKMMLKTPRKMAALRLRMKRRISHMQLGADVQEYHVSMNINNSLCLKPQCD